MLRGHLRDCGQEAEDRDRHQGGGRQPQEEVEGDVAVRALDQVRNHAVETRKPPIWLRLRRDEIPGAASMPPIQSGESPPA